MVLAVKRGVDFLGNKVFYDFSPPILGLPEVPIHHVVSQVERVLKAYKIDLPRYYNRYGATSTKTRNRQRIYFGDVSKQVYIRNRQRSAQSGLYRKSFKRKGRFSRYRYRFASRRSFRRSYY